MNKQELVKQYFRAFETKDLEELEKLFSDLVVLRDWEIEEYGKAAVLAANEKIFNTVGTICVEILSMHSTESSVVNEILIAIDDDVRLLVADIIEFDDDNKISAIRAYKGN